MSRGHPKPSPYSKSQLAAAKKGLSANKVGINGSGQVWIIN